MNKRAIVSFVPVIHKGYVDFFNKNKGDIFIFGDSVVNSFVHLTRDLRVMDEASCVSALQALFPGRSVIAADEKVFWELSRKKTPILMPEDEVNREVAEKYFKENQVTYISVFLRWNRTITLTEHQIPAHRKITTEQFHRKFIKHAEAEAEKSSDWWRQIGSVLLKDGKILYRSHNHHLPSDHHLSTFGDPRSNFDAGQHPEIYTSIHSEANFIAQAAHDGVSLEGTALYVTTFPCANCARLLTKAGIKKVFYSKGYSLLDAEKILDHFGVEVFLVQ